MATLSSVATFIKTESELMGQRELLNSLSVPERNKRNNELREKYHDILRSENTSPVADKMFRLRRLVLDCGLPDNTEEEDQSYDVKCSLRALVWKLLLGALSVDANKYVDLVELGPCNEDKKIRNDTFRTYKNNDEFWGRVDEGKLARVLNVFARTNSACGTEDRQPSPGYVQGMNVLAAPFLFLMPEIDAYTAFSTLITRHCPRYVLSNLDGAHHGCTLVDRLLELLDPALHAHINDRICRAEIFAFQFTITLLANMSPLQEVVRVWDAIFAFGIHFAVLLVTAHVMRMRDKLLVEDKAFRIQRMIFQEPLDARVLVGCALSLVKFIPEGLFCELMTHPVERPSDVSKVLSRDYERAGAGSDVLHASGRRPLSVGNKTGGATKPQRASRRAVSPSHGTNLSTDRSDCSGGSRRRRPNCAGRVRSSAAIGAGHMLASSDKPTRPQSVKHQTPWR